MGRRREFLKKYFGGGASGSSLPAGMPSTDNTDASGLPVNQAKATSFSDNPQRLTPATAKSTSNVTSGCSTEPSSLPYTPDPSTEIGLKTTEPQLVTSIEQQTSELSTSQRLWNAAYDSLESDEDTAKLARYYIKTLTHVLSAEVASDVSVSEDGVLTELKDPTKRQEYMRKLLDEGQKKVAISSKVLGMVGDAAQIIDSAKEMINAAIQNVPQAALPWAGVCIGLQILLNPAKVTKANLTGITHVTSRMKWYCALTEHLLNKENITIKNEPLVTVLNALEEEFVKLYKSIILYQMNSICSYYRNQGLVFLQSLVNIYDWDGDLKSLEVVEDLVERKSKQYHREYEKSSLSMFIASSREMEKHLSSIYRDLGSFIADQKKARMDDKLTECLRDLHVVDPHDDMNTIEKKKDILLKTSCNWIFDRDEYDAFTNWEESDSSPSRLLWIKGSAGTGKTMLLIRMIRELKTQHALRVPNLSYFFFQGTGDQELATATSALRSLMWLLLFQQPRLSYHLLSKYEKAGRPLFSDRNAFEALSAVFKSMLQDSQLCPVYFVIDALDECNQGLTELIGLISTTLTLSTKIRWLISSRPEVKLDNPDTTKYLIELYPSVLKDPVNKYIEHKLFVLKGKEGYDDEILAHVSEVVYQRANNTFLWVALVFKVLDSVEGWYAIDLINSIPEELNKLYTYMMMRIERRNPQDLEYCKRILVVAFLAYRPLSLAELALLAGLPPKMNPQTIIDKCGSFLTVDGGTVYLIHQSAKDYLNENYESKLQPGGAAHGHMDIYERSINAISRLPQNIYNLPDFGLRSKDTQPPNPDPLDPMRYACLFWADHFCDAYSSNTEHRSKSVDDGTIWLFLKDHILRWVESISLLGRLPEGLRSIRKILQELQPSISPQLTGFLKDAEKFLLSNGSIVDRAPLQTYGSALIFSPKSNEVRQRQWKEKLSFIEDIQGVKESDIFLQTLEGHSDWVRAIAFSPDGKTLASGSADKTIRLWDATIGAYQQTLEGHSDSVLAIAFSPDGKTLASGSADKTIRLWDAAIGAYQQKLEGHSDSVLAIAFSPDGKTLASAADKTIRLWDAATGAYQQTLEGHRDSVLAIAFSPDGKTLASGSDDTTIRLWDAATGAYQQTIEGHSDWVRAIAFSPDGKMLASGSADKTIRLWDAATGAYQQTLEGHSDSVRAIAFSPDGKTLASGSADGTIQLWDAATGAYRQALRGYGGWVLAIAFSPDGKTLASGSDDTTIRLWDAATGAYQQTLEGHSDSVRAIAFSPDGKALASGSADKTIRLWDTATGAYQRMLEGHSRSVRAIAFSPDGKTLASGSADKTIRLWDAATGAYQQTLEGHSDSVLAIAFSPDGKTLASGSDDTTIQLWYAATGAYQQTLEGHSDWVRAIAFSPDGKTLASGSDDTTIQLWDAATGAYQQTLEGHSDSVRAIAFSPDGKTLASGSADGTIQLWDAATGAYQQTLECDGSEISGITFSADSQYLKTNLGYIRISQSNTPYMPLSYAFFLSDEWITRDGKYLLWLPKDYRTEHVAMQGSTIVLGHDLRVTFLRLNVST